MPFDFLLYPMYYYIVNPIAGNHKFDQIQQEFLAAIRVKKIEGEIAKTTSPNEAKKLARMGIRRGNRVIVAVGGDATVEEVLNGILEEQKAGVALGIVPTGERNQLATMLGIIDWQTALTNLAKGKIKRVGVGQVEEYYFLGSVDFGFPNYLRDIYTNSRQKLNFWNRFRINLKVIKGFKPLAIDLKVSSHYRANLKVFAGSFGNLLFFGQKDSFRFNPDLENQKLNALFLHPFEFKNLWFKCWELSRGRFSFIDQYSLIKEQKFLLQSEQKINFATFAYQFMANEANFSFHNKALSVIVGMSETVSGDSVGMCKNKH